MKRTKSPKSSSIMTGPIIVSLMLGGIVILTVLAIVIFAALPASERKEFLSGLQEGVPENHSIPEGYTGWVSVEHNIAGEDELSVEEGVNIFRYSDSGVLRTSTRWSPGIKQKTYFYVTEAGPVKIASSGRDRQIWGSRDVTIRDVKDGPIKSRKSYFFVGNKKDYKKAGRYFEKVDPLRSLSDLDQK